MDSLANVSEFVFEIEQSIIDDMKNRYTHYKEANKISNSDIDNFFGDKGIAILKTQDIRINPLDAITGQIDGAYYDIKTKIKYNGKEPISYSFNIKSLGPRDSEMKQWLILYSLFQDNDIFETISVKQKCFKKEDFQKILFRFILYNKNL